LFPRSPRFYKLALLIKLKPDFTHPNISFFFKRAYCIIWQGSGFNNIFARNIILCNNW